MWIEIFRGGPQTDATGVTHDGDWLIEQAVANFAPEQHRPPLVLGHPRDDSPSYGWVERLEARVHEGLRSLWAEISPVQALRQWVQERLYTNRSAAFYPNGRLRHVGFLGGMPPAVKGLAPLPAFADEADGSFEFLDGAPSVPAPHHAGGNKMKFSVFLEAINVFKRLGGTDAEIDAIAPAPAPPAKPAEPAAPVFSEADIEAARAAAAAEARAAVQAEFAEREAAARRQARTAEIQAFVDAGVASGKIAPAWVNAGLGAFMQSLDDGQALSFAEGQDPQTPAAWFRQFLDGLPTLVNFAEVATRDKALPATGEAGTRLAQIVRQKIAEGKLAYGAAFAEAQRENPDLAAAYAAEL